MHSKTFLYMTKHLLPVVVLELSYKHKRNNPDKLQKHQISKVVSANFTGSEFASPTEVVDMHWGFHKKFPTILPLYRIALFCKINK